MAKQGYVHPARIVEKTSNNVVVAFSDDFCAGVQQRSYAYNARRATEDHNTTPKSQPRSSVSTK